MRGVSIHLHIAVHATSDELQLILVSLAFLGIIDGTHRHLCKLLSGELVKVTSSPFTECRLHALPKLAQPRYRTLKETLVRHTRESTHCLLVDVATHARDNLTQNLVVGGSLAQGFKLTLHALPHLGATFPQLHATSVQLGVSFAQHLDEDVTMLVHGRVSIVVTTAQVYLIVHGKAKHRAARVAQHLSTSLLGVTV